jgi:HrpA-like RNA helicase
MPLPTLYTKGSLRSLNPKVPKEELDNYIPVHYVLNICMHKLNKQKDVNRHDRLFLLKSETGSGKTTAFILELYRVMYLKNYSMFPEKVAEQKQAFRKFLPSDFTVFDFPDDEYTLANRKAGTIKTVSKKLHYIACTQPKSVTAREKADENASEPFNPDIILGENIGYSTGNFKMGFRNTEGMLYLTMGSMAQYLKTHTDQEIMERYDVICIDECHERSVELDCGVKYLRDILDRNAGNPYMPLIIFMSATFEISKFASYMGTPAENAVFVVGESSTKEIRWLKTPMADYYAGCAKLVMQIHNEFISDIPEERDVLIFVSGDPAAKRMKKAIEALDKNGELLLLIVTSTTYNANQAELMNLLNNFTVTEAAEYAKKPTATRRVSIATNVIETGLTIKTLKYVIETGWEKTSAYSPIHNLAQLLTKPLTQSSATQRFGRVGRRFFGYVYPLYSEEDYNYLDQYALPSIYTSNITKNVMEIMYSAIPAEQVFMPLSPQQFSAFIKECLPECAKVTDESNNCYNLLISDRNVRDQNIIFGAEQFALKPYPPKMLDNLPQDTYITCRNKLINLGFYGTYIGYIASKISRLSAENIRMVMAGYAYGCSINDLLTIASLAASTEGKYMVDRMGAKREKRPAFSIFTIARDLISKESLQKYYFGDIGNFLNLFHDDFIRGLMIMRWVVMKCRQKGARNIEKECSNVGLKWRDLMISLDDRMSAVKDFNKYGFTNIFPELDFNSETIVDDICRIKRCIYAGFKNNVAYLTASNTYKTPSGLEFNYSGYALRRPKKVIYSFLFMKERPQSVFYDVSTNSVCSLDGII